MWLIVGLGNPEARYARDRHNIGFRIIEHISQRFKIPLDRRRHRSFLGQGFINHTPVILAQPQTYMNLSGQAVVPICQTHQISLEHILILHDDLDLEFARLRLKQGGGAGGHNGLRSLNESLGSREYGRLRFGVGRPPHREMDIADYVLSPFSPEQETQLPDLIEQATEMVVCACTDGLTAAMNQWNRKKPEPPTPLPSKKDSAAPSPQNTAQVSGQGSKKE